MKNYSGYFKALFILFTFVSVALSGYGQKDFPDKVLNSIRTNDVSGVEDALGKKVTITSVNSAGNTLLHDACSNDSRKDVAKMLINKGSDVNAKNNLGYTPLHIAALNGSSEIIKLLLENGADKNAKDNDGNTPYDRAVWVQQTRVYELLK